MDFESLGLFMTCFIVLVSRAIVSNPRSFKLTDLALLDLEPKRVCSVGALDDDKWWEHDIGPPLVEYRLIEAGAILSVGDMNPPFFKKFIEGSFSTLTRLEFSIIRTQFLLNAFKIASTISTIQHLSLLFQPSNRPYEPVDTYLHLKHFQSLTSLKIKDAAVMNILAILKSLESNRLVLLELGPISNWLTFAAEEGMTATAEDAWLYAAVRLPVLSQLKRWRFDRTTYPSKDTKEGQVFFAQCEERGIEVRDERRFYTGT